MSGQVQVLELQIRSLARLSKELPRQRSVEGWLLTNPATSMRSTDLRAEVFEHPPSNIAEVQAYQFVRPPFEIPEAWGGLSHTRKSKASRTLTTFRVNHLHMDRVQDYTHGCSFYMAWRTALPTAGCWSLDVRKIGARSRAVSSLSLRFLGFRVALKPSDGLFLISWVHLSNPSTRSHQLPKTIAGFSGV